VVVTGGLVGAESPWPLAK